MRRIRLRVNSPTSIPIAATATGRRYSWKAREHDPPRAHLVGAEIGCGAGKPSAAYTSASGLMRRLPPRDRAAVHAPYFAAPPRFRSPAALTRKRASFCSVHLGIA
jgi:hypothetical protein